MNAKGVITRVRSPRRLRDRSLVDVVFDDDSTATLYSFNPDEITVGDVVILEIRKPKSGESNELH